MSKAHDLPLSGIRVLDFSRVLAGPLATQNLGDLGADVLKIERPGVGDDTRGWGPPFVGDDAAYFFSVNRNKRSLALDLADADDLARAVGLAESADVVVENFRPGLMRRFGLDFESLRERNSGLVYCSLLAFGDDEDDSKPGYDIIVQALSGLMSVTGEPGQPPVKVGVALLDVITGLYASTGILAALREREATGTGRRITVSLFEASVAAMVNQASNHLLGGLVPGPMGTAHPNIVPYQIFDAADRPFILAAGNDRLFERTCEVLGRPDLAERYPTNADRVTARSELVPELQAAFAARPAAEWLADLEARAVPCAPIRTMDEVFASPEGSALIQDAPRDERGPVRMVANPIRWGGEHLPVRLAPPRLDADEDGWPS